MWKFVKAFFSTVVSTGFGFKGLAIAAAISAIVSGGGVGILAYKLHNGAMAKLQAANAARIIEATNAATAAVQAQFTIDRDELEQLRRRFQDAQAETSPGECLPAADVERLRRALEQASRPRRRTR